MNKFGFMPGQFNMEAIFLLRCLMEKYREACKELYMVFFIICFLIDNKKFY